MEQLHTFKIQNFEFEVRIKERWLEYTIYAPNGEWRRFFISKAGFNGHIDEIIEVGHSLLRKAGAAV